MKSKEIKQKYDAFVQTISEAQQEILDLQHECRHEIVFEGNLSANGEYLGIRDICTDCGFMLPKAYNSHLHYSEVKYRDVCQNCKPYGNCGCSMANTIVKQYFNLNQKL